MYKYYFFFLLILFSCSETKTERIIPEDKMVNILVDIHLTEGKVNGIHLGSVDSSLIVYNYFEKQVFKKYQVDSTSFNKCLNSYLREPTELKKLYLKVTKKINAISHTPNKTLKPV